MPAHNNRRDFIVNKKQRKKKKHDRRLAYAKYRKTGEIDPLFEEYILRRIKQKERTLRNREKQQEAIQEKKCAFDELNDFALRCWKDGLSDVEIDAEIEKAVEASPEIAPFFDEWKANRDEARVVDAEVKRQEILEQLEQNPELWKSPDFVVPPYPEYPMEPRGYSGWSLSNNAGRAYENGLIPKSKITRKLLDTYDVNISVAKAKACLGLPLEWHHTSKYANETDFYDLLELLANIRDTYLRK